MRVFRNVLASFLLLSSSDAFAPIKSRHGKSTPTTTSPTIDKSLTSLYAQEKGTIQILMSDTGGGHRASANALRDAFDELYPNQIEVDIVDIFTDYGRIFPFNQFVPIYKILAAYPFLWGFTFYSGASPFGLWFNELVLEVCMYPYAYLYLYFGEQFIIHVYRRNRNIHTMNSLNLCLSLSLFMFVFKNY